MSRRPPEPSDADIGKWKRLVREAKACAADPAAPAGNLAAAQKAAHRGVVIGFLDRTNPFVRLERAARVHVAATARGRREGAAELAALADECERLIGEHLNRPQPAAPKPPYYADAER